MLGCSHVGLPGILPEIAVLEAPNHPKLTVFVPAHTLSLTPGFDLAVSCIGEVVTGFLVGINRCKGLCGMQAREHLNDLATLHMEWPPLYA